MTRDRAAVTTMADAERPDRAVQLLFEAITAQAKFRRTGRDFLDAASGLDRGAIVRRAAERVRAKMRRKPPLPLAEELIWRDLKDMFGWSNLADLHHEGEA
jgi:hypothetical protein